MIRNQAGQAIGAQMIHATTGAAFVGPVTVHITGDGGAQAQGTVGAGLCVHEGNGYHSYVPAQAETAFDLIAFTFVGVGAIPTTVQVATLTLAQAAALAAIPPPGIASYSALDFATRALRLLGVIDAVQTPAPEDADAAFEALNDMVDNWATQRQTIFQIQRSVFPLAANVGSYTLGFGGVWNIIRPVWIDRCSVIPENSGAGNTGPMEIALGRPLDIQAYQQIPIKTATSSYPDRVYWDRHWVSGLSTVHVYPVPTNSNAAIVLYTPTALIQFPDLSTKFAFPPGYARAIRYNLAVDLAPEFAREIPKDVSQIARSSMADIKRANHAPTEAQFDVALVGLKGRYNIYSDGY